MLNYLYSIRPQHVLNIARGDKTYELRTKLPREMKEAINKGEKVVMWIYCTKGKNRHEELSFQPYGMSHSYLRPHGNGSWLLNNKELNYSKSYAVNGLVVAKCVVDSYEEVSNRFNGNEWVYDDWLLNVTCLDENQLDDYLKQDGNYRFGYALHLTQVEILDKPLQVGEFHSWNFNKWHEGRHWIPLTRAPQSYQKVKAPEGFHSCPTT